MNAVLRRLGPARNLTRLHGNLQMEMGEGVPDQAGHGRTCASGRRPVGFRSSRPGEPGTSIMPPRSPRSGRRRSRIAPSSRISQKARPVRTGLSGLRLLRGSSCPVPPPARSWTGHRRHLSRRGVRSGAGPSRPGHSRRAGNRASIGRMPVKQRFRRRQQLGDQEQPGHHPLHTFPSTTTARRSNAIAAIAAAV